MIKWGILAIGNIANKFVKTMNEMHEEMAVIACASRNEDKAKSFANQYHIPKYYGSYEALVQDPEIDIVYICTPNHLHYENMKMCIEAGKAVLCEKPFTMNKREAEAIFALAKEKGVFVMEAFWIKFLPLYDQLHEILESGTIGDIKHLRADYGFVVQGDRRIRKLSSDLGGGALLDIGIYTIGFASMIMGYHPHKIKSCMTINEYGTDSFETMILEYEQEKTASLTSSIGIVLPTEGVIYGTKGKIVLPDFQKAEKLLVLLNDGNRQDITRPFEFNGFEYQMREVARCLKSGHITSPKQTPENTLSVLDIMDELRKQGNLTYNDDLLEFNKKEFI